MGSLSSTTHYAGQLELADPTAIIGLAAGGIFLLVGLLFLVIGLVLRSSKQKKAKRCTAIAQGTVVDIVAHANRSSAPTFSPLYAYEVGGLQYFHSPSVSSTIINYAIGEPVTVYYNPHDPHECRLEKDTASKALTLIFICLGGGLAVLGAILMIALALIPTLS